MFEYENSQQPAQGITFGEFGGRVLDGIGGYVGGLGENQQNTADYNAAVVAAKNERTMTMRKATDAGIKIIAVLALTFCVVVLIRSLKK